MCWFLKTLLGFLVSFVNILCSVYPIPKWRKLRSILSAEVQWGSSLAGACPPYALVQPQRLSQPMLEAWGWQVKCHPLKPEGRGMPWYQWVHTTCWAQLVLSIVKHLLCSRTALFPWYIMVVKPRAPYAKYPTYAQNSESC